MTTIGVIVVLSCLALVNGAHKQKVGAPYSIDGRIIGGHDANITDYPYQVSLIYVDFGPFCGGVLISSKWVLTAAHCMYDTIAANTTVRAGSSLRVSDDGQIVQVLRVIQSEKFDYNTADADIALLELSSNITIATASPIKLASSSPSPGEIGIVTGWGITAENDVGWGSDVLQVLELPIVSHEDCKTAYDVKSQEITDNMFCAGYLGVGGKDTCTGDSGGPLVIGGALSGLISWGSGCAQAKFPGVYTDVSQFTEWIKENTGI